MQKYGFLFYQQKNNYTFSFLNNGCMPLLMLFVFLEKTKIFMDNSKKHGNFVN
jgi:hypothetical protein